MRAPARPRAASPHPLAPSVLSPAYSPPLLQHDVTHWTNAELEQQLAAGAPNFLDVVASWQEQRDWCATYAVEALEVGAHPLAPAVAAALADLFPPAAQPDPAALGFVPYAAGAVYSGSAVWTLAFDAATGALSYLKDARPGGRVWADAAGEGTSLATVHYTALSAADFDVFTGPEPNGYYPFPGTPPTWFQRDFGKPNVSSASPVHSETPAWLQGVYLKENATAAIFLVHTSWAQANAALHSYYGAPGDCWLELTVPRSGSGAIQGALTIFNKTATRLPEGLYLRFNASAAGGWRVGKLGSLVDPFDVVPGGNHHQHGLAGVVKALASDGAALSIASTDFSQVQFGRPIPLPAPVWANATSAAEGMSVLLVDNTWGARKDVAPTLITLALAPLTPPPTPSHAHALNQVPTTLRGFPGPRGRKTCGGPFPCLQTLRLENEVKYYEKKSITLCRAVQLVLAPQVRAPHAHVLIHQAPKPPRHARVQKALRL